MIIMILLHLPLVSETLPNYRMNQGECDNYQMHDQNILLLGNSLISTLRSFSFDTSRWQSTFSPVMEKAIRFLTMLESTLMLCLPTNSLMILSTPSKLMQAFLVMLSFSISSRMNFLFLLRRLMNCQQAGECLKSGIDFYLVGRDYSLSALSLKLSWPDWAGVVPMSRLGGLQVRKIWVNSWKSSWPSFLMSMNLKMSSSCWYSGRGWLAEWQTSLIILKNQEKGRYPVRGLFNS